MKNFKEIEKTAKDYFFHDLPVIGDPDLLKLIDKVLICDWEGNVTSIVDSLDLIAANNFEPRDKGMPGVYGCNKHGYVIASIVRYKGESKSLDPKEQNEHYAVWSAKHTGNY